MMEKCTSTAAVARFVCRLACVLMTLPAAGIASAQTFPSRPLRIIVPYVGGGVVDALARTTGQHISASVGQPVVVENRPGAASMIGMRACAQAPSDGYTVCMTVADSLTYNPFLYTKLLYDPEQDFAPVINVVRSNGLLLAHANAPFDSIKELIATAKAKPGSVNWGTWGAGSIPDVYLRWLRHQAGVEITAVPYKGTGQAVPALIAGEVAISFSAIGAMLPHIKAGKLKPIAIIGSQRFALLPGVPSLAEDNADPGLRSYFGIFAPAKTPPPIVDRINAEFSKALQTPEVRKFAVAQTLDIVGGSASEFAAFLKEETSNAARVFRTLGIHATDAPL